MGGFLQRALLRGRLRGRGIEIGAHGLPLPGIRPIYVDRYREFAGIAGRVDVIAEAERLPFGDGSLDYLAASHVIEHLVNPVRALVEWGRVVRRGGWICLVVPDRRYTFDRPRACAPVAHLIEDFEANVDARDTTHFEDYVFNRELAGSRLAAGTPPEQWPALRRRILEELRATAASGGLPSLHYHVFEPANLRELLAWLAWDIVRFEERYPTGRGDGMLVLARAGALTR